MSAFHHVCFCFFSRTFFYVFCVFCVFLTFFCVFLTFLRTCFFWFFFDMKIFETNVTRHGARHYLNTMCELVKLIKNLLFYKNKKNKKNKKNFTGKNI